MIRYHKRHLKSVRVEKKTNHSKELVGGTGLRFCSNAVGDPPMNREDVSDNTHKQQWLINHPGQVMESAVHDRTKWASNKAKSQVRRAQRQTKMDC